MPWVLVLGLGLGLGNEGLGTVALVTVTWRVPNLDLGLEAFVYQSKHFVANKPFVRFCEAFSWLAFFWFLN